MIYLIKNVCLTAWRHETVVDLRSRIGGMSRNTSSVLVSLVFRLVFWAICAWIVGFALHLAPESFRRLLRFETGVVDVNAKYVTVKRSSSLVNRRLAPSSSMVAKGAARWNWGVETRDLEVGVARGRTISLHGNEPWWGHFVSVVACFWLLCQVERAFELETRGI